MITRWQQRQSKDDAAHALAVRATDKAAPCAASARFVSLAARPSFVLVLLLLFLLAGCFRRSTTPTMSFNLNELLPAGWTPVGTVQEVNIDGDPAVERLVFFSYDKSPQNNGPVGALIYDLREDKAIVTTQGASVANQSSSSLMRYQILPSYWQGAGQGFIAEPGQAGNILVNTVTYNAKDAQGAAVTRQELIVRGGSTYLTFIWWKGATDGYGVTQLYAPGGFLGVDWTTWARTPAPILQITGLYPLQDRNLLCRKVTYDRVDSTPTNLAPLVNETVPYRQDIHYTASNRGLDFCAGAPAHPFYAEGVVLAYLLDPAKHTDLLDTSLQSADAITATQRLLATNQLILVDDVRGQQDIPIARPDLIAPDVSVQTQVCAKVLVWTDAVLKTYEPRWLLFTLRYVTPQPDTTAIDQLLILNVNRLAAPVNGNGLDCTQIMQGLPQ